MNGFAYFAYFLIFVMNERIAMALVAHRMRSLAERKCDLSMKCAEIHPTSLCDELRK